MNGNRTTATFCIYPNLLNSANERYVRVNKIGGDKAALIVREALVSVEK